MSEKYYYELTNGDETFYCTVNLPIKEEKLPEAIGMPDYKAKQITKKEYEREANADE